MYLHQRPALLILDPQEPHNPRESYPYSAEKIADNAMIPWGVPKSTILGFYWSQEKIVVSGGWL